MQRAWQVKVWERRERDESGVRSERSDEVLCDHWEKCDQKCDPTKNEMQLEKVQARKIPQAC